MIKLKENYYKDWFMQQANEYFTEKGIDESQIQAQIESNTIFLTATLDRKRLSQRINETSKSQTDIIHDSFRKLYIDMVKDCLSKPNKSDVRSSKCKSMQPLCFSFIDYNSKYKNHISEFDINGLHIHALIVSDPKFTGSILRWLKQDASQNYRLSHLEFDSVDAKRYEAGNKSMEDVVRYAAKATRINQRSGIAMDDVRIYPEFRHSFRPEPLKTKKINFRQTQHLLDQGMSIKQSIAVNNMMQKHRAEVLARKNQTVQSPHPSTTK